MYNLSFLHSTICINKTFRWVLPVFQKNTFKKKKTETDNSDVKSVM